MASLKRIAQKTWLAAFLVMSVVFIVAYFKDDRDKISRILDADLRLLTMAAAAQAAYFLATIMTWQKALLYATGKTVALRESLSQILMVNFGKYIPGKVWGMAARGKRLAEAGYDLEEITRASYLEQILLLLTGFALGFLAAALVFASPLYGFAFAVSVAGIVLFRYDHKIIGKIAHVIPPVRSLLRFFEVRLSSVQVLKLSAGYVLVWLLLACAFMFMCMSVIGVELTPVSGLVFVLSLTAGFLAGFLALFAPGGAGVREGVGAALLTSIVTLEEAVLLMLLFRVWVVAAEMLAGALVFLLPASGKAPGENNIGG
ncbi:MAG: hypothetical protein EX272_02980 [Chromatiales bacterium]|nr:MAG: hypothetical protein EX272_02980 [Chromatiales bacterium]